MAGSKRSLCAVQSPASAEIVRGFSDLAAARTRLGGGSVLGCQYLGVSFWTCVLDKRQWQMDPTLKSSKFRQL